MDACDDSGSSGVSGDSGVDPGDGLGERLGDGLGDGLDSGTGVEDSALSPSVPVPAPSVSSSEVLVAGAAWELLAIAGTPLQAREAARHAEASANTPMRREAMVFPPYLLDESCPVRVPDYSSVRMSKVICKGNPGRNRTNVGIL